MIDDYYDDEETGAESGGKAEVTVRAGKVSEVTITRTPKVPVFGQVTGKVISGHDVQVMAAPDRSSEPTFLDSENGVVSYELAPGRYYVWLAGRNVPARVVDVRAGRTADFGTIVDGDQWTTVKGRIVHADGVPCHACLFVVRNAQGLSAIGDFADRNGNYRFTGLAAGRYTVNVWDTRRRNGQGARLLTRRAFTVPEGATQVTRNVRLVEGYTISGRVLVNGRPLGNALLFPYTATAHGPPVLTDALGRFTFRYLKSGRYALYAQELAVGGYRPRVLDLTVGGASRSGLTLRFERGTAVPVDREILHEHLWDVLPAPAQP